MTPKERAIRALRREGPDKVPRDIPWGSFTPELMNTFKEKTGATDPAEYFNYEVRMVSFKRPEHSNDFLKYFDTFPKDIKDNLSIDCWGTGRHKGSEHHFERLIFPMQNLSSAYEIEKYPFPDFSNPAMFEHLKKETEAYHKRDLAVAGELACTIFEVSWGMRGMEELLMDFVTNPELAEVLLDKVTKIRIDQIIKYVNAGVDIIFLGDDVGQQTGLIMSPKTWREWLKPRTAQIISAAKNINPDILIFYHSDGSVKPIIPELIEIGIDILNPIQPECMDPKELKQLYGDKLSFWGTIGTQTTMPFGTPTDVKNKIREMIQSVGEGGGLFLAPTHILEPEVPWENVIAFFEAIDEYGYYS